MRSCLFLSFILLIICAACNASVAEPIFATVPADATSTPTPFQPEFVFIPSFTASQYKTFPTPELFPANTQIPTPANLISQPEGQVSILVLGSDQRPNAGDFRTDVIMLMIIMKNGSISLVSFPRDLYVYIPGWRMQRINTAQAHGGFETTVLTFEYNFGIHPDHYILTNFSGFKAIVDSLGGIDVNVARSLSDQRDGYVEPYTIPVGIVHMNGETALWYVRSRYSTSDFYRLSRAQELITAIGHKIISLDGLNHAPDLYNAFISTVDTDLSLGDLLIILPLLQSVDPNRVNQYVINKDQVISWVEPDTGAQLLLPKLDAIRQILQQAVGTP